jgi:peptidylprolyl isomerase
MAAAPRSRPEIDMPVGEPPTELVVVDEVVGDGEEAQARDTVDVHYTGISWSTGEEFDSSWNRGEPLRFTLGVGQVIPGWDQGVQGMRVGGRRRLEIPAHLAYGKRGAPPVIAPDETLIFVCDLENVTRR